MNTDELENLFITKEYSLFIRELSKKSLTKDFSNLFVQSSNSFDKSWNDFLSDDNIHYVEEFFFMFKEKMIKEFKGNENKKFVVETISEIVNRIFTDFSSKSNEGGVFTYQKSSKSIKESVKFCMKFKELSDNCSQLSYTDQPPLWFMRFNQEGWEDGAKSILDCCEEKLKYAETKKEQKFYAEYLYNCLNCFLNWKDTNEYIEIIPEIAKKINTIDFEFGLNCGLYLPGERDESKDRDRDEEIVLSLLNNNIKISKIGHFDYWIANPKILQKVIVDLPKEDVIEFIKNIQYSLVNAKFIRTKDISILEGFCNNKILNDELNKDLKIKQNKNNKIKI